MNRFFGKIQGGSDVLFSTPTKGVLMAKTANDNAIIASHPDTHPSPWQWAINPTPTTLDDYKFPNRWAQIQSKPFPEVLTNAWRFPALTLSDQGTEVVVRGIQTSYDVYQGHTDFTWETNWNLQGGYLSGGLYRDGDLYRKQIGDFIPTAPYIFDYVAGKVELRWGLGQPQTNQFDYSWAIYTQITETFGWLIAYSELQLWISTTKVWSMPLHASNVRTRITLQNNQLSFFIQTVDDLEINWTQVYSVPAGTIRRAFYLTRFLGIEQEGAFSQFSHVDNFNTSTFEYRLTTNRTTLFSPTDGVIFQTPTRSLGTNKIVRIQTPTPNIQSVFYRKGGTWYPATGESNQVWKVETGSQAISDFAWRVHGSRFLESFYEQEQDGAPQGGGSNPSYTVTVNPLICQHEPFTITIQPSNAVGDTLWIKLYRNNELYFVDELYLTNNNTIVRNIHNEQAGDHKVEVFSSILNTVVVTREWKVYPCDARPKKAGRYIWTIGLVRQYQCKGELFYTQSDATNTLIRESGAWWEADESESQ